MTKEEKKDLVITDLVRTIELLTQMLTDKDLSVKEYEQLGYINKVIRNCITIYKEL